MRSGLQTEARTEDRSDLDEMGPDTKGLRTGDDLEKRFPVAMALYGILGLLVWFTMDAGKTMVLGRPVELKLVPLVILAGLALRTVLGRHAERIRRGKGRS